MKIFLSWSGEKSKKIAAILNEWLPSVIQAIKPYYSKEGIPKGRKWSPELSKELEESHVGIIVLTPENLQSAFIHYEAGALSKNQESGRVSTMLFGVKESDVESPLSEFQNTKFTHDDVFRLMRDVNILLGESKLDDKVLKNVFDKMWPEFEEKITEIMSSTPDTPIQSRDTEDIIEEILEHVRKISSKLAYSSNYLNFGSSAVSEHSTFNVPFASSPSGNFIVQTATGPQIYFKDPVTGALRPVLPTDSIQRSDGIEKN